MGAWAAAAYGYVFGASPAPPDDTPPGLPGCEVRIGRARDAVGQCRTSVDELFKALTDAETAARKRIEYPTRPVEETA